MLRLWQRWHLKLATRSPFILVFWLMRTTQHLFAFLRTNPLRASLPAKRFHMKPNTTVAPCSRWDTVMVAAAWCKAAATRKDVMALALPNDEISEFHLKLERNMLLFSLLPINNRKLCQRIPRKDQANRGEQHEARVVDYHMLPRSNHGRVLIVAHFWHQTTCHNIGIPYCLYLRQRHGYPKEGNTWRFVALSLKMVYGSHHGNLLIRKVPNQANMSWHKFMARFLA